MSMSFWDSEFTLSLPFIDGKSMTIQNVGELPGGRYVVTWSGTGDGGDAGGGGSWADGVRAAIFNQDGSLVGNSFIVNTTTMREQNGSSLAVLSDGRFVIVWQSNEDGDGGTVNNDNCIRARVFNADGTPALYDGTNDGIANAHTGDFVVNTIAGNSQWNPQVIAMDNGGFFVAFASVLVDDYFGDHQVQGRMFGPASGEGSNEFTLNNTVNTGEDFVNITKLEEGGFVVTWTDSAPANNFGVGATGNNNVARVFNEDGSPRTSAFLVATNPVFNPSSQGLSQPHVGALEDGGFVVAWTFPDDGPDGPDGDGSVTSIVARIFEADGTPRTGEFQVNTTTDHDQRMANIVGLDDGRFMVSFWSRSDGNGNLADTLMARVFDPDGTPEPGGDWILNLGPGTAGGATAGSPSDLIETSDGRILAIYNNDINGPITGRFLDPTPQGNIQPGNANANIIVGNAGNDTLGGGDKGDRLYAGGGDDIARGGTGFDTVSGGGGGDFLYGDEGNDRLIGGEGNDSLEGGTGADNMAGGTGHDVYYIDNTGDVVTESVGGTEGGHDTVYSSVDRALHENFETLRLLGTTGLTGHGNGLDNDIFGTAGNDRLKGMEGNDSLYGGAGVDRMEGGNGNDVYGVDNADDKTIETGGTNGGIDTVLSSVSRRLGASLENLTLIGNDDINGFGNDAGNTIKGNSGDNLIEGGGWYDFLTGGGGNDTLDGNEGYDTMTGGGGDDTYYVDHSADQTIEQADGGTDLVISYYDWTLGGHVENLRLVGPSAYNGTGNGRANDILGNARNNLLQGMGGNDTLDGGDGTDTLDGGAGNDTLIGGPHGDVFRFATTQAGADSILHFNKTVDRFDLSGGSFSGRTIDGADTILTHDGGTIRLVGVTNLSLAQANALVLPSGGDAGGGPVGFDAFRMELAAMAQNEIVHLGGGDWLLA